MGTVHKTWAAGVAMAVAALAAGCDKAPKTFDVSGTVTFKGGAVPKGMVWFAPTSTDKTAGAQGYAPITDGRFNTAEGGRGVAEGQYAVRIEAGDSKPAAEMPIGKPLRATPYETSL